MSRHRLAITRALWILFAVAGVVAFGLGGGLAWAAEPPVVASASQLAAFPVPIVELRGDPAELGKSHGTRFRDEMRLLPGDYITRFLAEGGKGVDRETLRKAATGFEPLIRPEHLKELQALASAAGVDPRDVLLLQCFTDLALAGGCSTITLSAAASSDRVARFGRNLDFPALDILDRHAALLIFHPKNRFAFAAVSWPGLLGVLSGMNEHGLTLANMEVYRPRRAPAGMPYMLLYRTVLEQCKTVQEAIAFLEKTPRQSTNNLMLMDASGQRAVAEITPEKVTVRRGADTAALISTNHQRGADHNTPGRCNRYDLLHDSAARDFGRLSVAAVEEMLAGAAQGDATIQSMVFEPASRVLYLAVGANAPKHGFSKVELKRYFR